MSSQAPIDSGSSFMNSFGGNVLGSAANSLMSFGLGQLGSGLNAKRSWKYAKKAMALQNQYNIEAAQRSFDYSLKACQMENEYNTPANQMARYKDAGLNPNLIYGSSNTGGTLNAPTVHGSSLPSVNTSAGQTFNILDGVSALQNIIMNKKQADLIQANIDSINQKIAESIERSSLYKIQASQRTFDYDLKRLMKDDIIRNLQFRNSVLKEQGPLYEFEAKMKRKEYEDYMNTGVRPGDSIWVRILAILAQKMGIGFNSIPSFNLLN